MSSNMKFYSVADFVIEYQKFSNNENLSKNEMSVLFHLYYAFLMNKSKKGIILIDTKEYYNNRFMQFLKTYFNNALNKVFFQYIDFDYLLNEVKTEGTHRIHEYLFKIDYGKKPNNNKIKFIDSLGRYFDNIKVYGETINIEVEVLKQLLRQRDQETNSEYTKTKMFITTNLDIAGLQTKYGKDLFNNLTSKNIIIDTSKALDYEYIKNDCLSETWQKTKHRFRNTENIYLELEQY